jgi:hypothetical protein
MWQRGGPQICLGVKEAGAKKGNDRPMCRGVSPWESTGVEVSRRPRTLQAAIPRMALMPFS